MKTHDAELGRIKDLLQGNPRGIKITRIARDLGMNRNAAAKYLEILLMTGQVEVLEHGMSKIFILSRRTGIPTMLDGSPDMILVLDAGLRIARVNGHYLKYAGRKQEDLLGKRADAFVLPILGCSRVLDGILQARFGEDARMEIREADSEGRVCYFDVRLTPAVFNDGTRGITVIIGDITNERKMQETAAAESKKLVEGILACIDDPVVLLDARSRRIAFLNPAACRMFGYGQGEYAGKDAGILAGTTGTIPGYSALVEEDFHRYGFFETRSPMRRADGREFAANLQLRPVMDNKGELRNIVMIVRDVTTMPGTGHEVVHGAGDSSRIQPAIFSSACRSPYPAI
jgi:PAS domain S-box-containing protein